VSAMRLTWKDGVTTFIMALVALVYVLYLSSTDVAFISDTRGATAAILLLGMIGCGYGGADQLYKTAAPKTTATLVFQALSTTLGVIALFAALFALIAGTEFMLGLLVSATGALWLTATIRHIAGAGTARQTPLPRKEVNTP
jgi:hypothetical protein